jgi:hypothetical protein
MRIISGADEKMSQRDITIAINHEVASMNLPLQMRAALRSPRPLSNSSNVELCGQVFQAGAAAPPSECDSNQHCCTCSGNTLDHACCDSASQCHCSDAGSPSCY